MRLPPDLLDVRAFGINGSEDGLELHPLQIHLNHQFSLSFAVLAAATSSSILNAVMFVVSAAYHAVSACFQAGGLSVPQVDRLES